MKAKVSIAKVPWQISPSVPDMAIVNTDDEGLVTVEFLGNLLHQDGKLYHCCMTLRFKGCIKSFYSPCYEELSLFDDNEYDLSEITKNYQPQFSRSSFYSKWVKNNVCLDPEILLC